MTYEEVKKAVSNILANPLTGLGKLTHEELIADAVMAIYNRAEEVGTTKKERKPRKQRALLTPLDNQDPDQPF